MAEKDGWIAKDKYGEFWLGTFGADRQAVESHIENSEWRKEYQFKIVKVKLVEVADGS